MLALLVGQTLFAPRGARIINWTCAVLACATAVGSLARVPDLTFAHIYPTVRLMASCATLVVLIGFITETVHEYARLREEHHLMQTMAMCDPLTGLSNRRACEASLVREIAL